MKVAILMSTYNGEKYLEEQIKSIMEQSEKSIELIIRDDGSSDSTGVILNKYSKKYSNIKIINGKNLGVAGSFKELLKCKCDASYFAFCDQDDIWLKDKVKMALSKLKEFDDEPALYYSEVIAVNENLEKLFVSNYTGIDTIGSSYNTTPVIGCTTVFNNKLKEIIEKYEFPENIVMHDLYLYRVCLAIDGKIIHDNNSYIYYRQHSSNVIGISNSNLKKIKIYNKYNKTRRKMAKDILRIYFDIISVENRKILKKIAMFDDKMGSIKKISIIFDKNYNSKKFKSNLKFIYDVLFNNI